MRSINKSFCGGKVKKVEVVVAIILLDGFYHQVAIKSQFVSQQSHLHEFMQIASLATLIAQ